MKTNNYLFPHSFKKIGWIMFYPFAAIGIWFLADPDWFAPFWDNVFDKPQSVWDGIMRYRDEVAVIGLTLSLLFIGFSREKIEDEYVAKLRGDSLVWSMLVGYGLLILATVFLYDENYLTFMLVNLFLILMLYIVKFTIALHRFSKSGSDEK